MLLLQVGVTQAHTLVSVESLHSRWLAGCSVVHNHQYPAQQVVSISQHLVDLTHSPFHTLNNTHPLTDAYLLSHSQTGLTELQNYPTSKPITVVMIKSSK